jgi:type I restriction enzyme S subunit
MFVSDKFPTYEVDHSVADLNYLRWYFRFPRLWDDARRLSTGSAALSKLTLNPPKFLELTIPLPPMDEQRRIVVRIEEIAEKVSEVQTLRMQVAGEIESLITSFHIAAAKNRKRRISSLLRLEEVAVPVSATGEYPQVGVRSFGAGLFSKAPTPGSATTYRYFHQLYEGAVVLSQVKAWEGAIAVCPPELAGWFVSPEYRTFRCDPAQVRPGYLTALVGTEWFWSKLQSATRGVGARRERTRPEQFLKLEIAMPDLPDQEAGEAIFGRLKKLRIEQAEAAVELDAILPAILDRAFKGEL